MNADQLKGKWKQFQGEAKLQWGKLTDNDWRTAEGNAEKLAGKLQEHYGDTKEEAHKKIDTLFNTLK